MAIFFSAIKQHCEAIIFDFDGVLVESVDVKTQAFARLYQSYGKDIVASVIKYHLMHGGVSRVDKIKYYQQLVGATVDEAEEFRLVEQFSKLVEESVVCAHAVPGSLAFLQSLRGRVDLYVASGTPEDELRRIVAKRELEQYFLGVYGSPRKKEAIIGRLLDENNYSRAKVVMIGDAMTDLLAARHCDINFLARITDDNENIFPMNTLAISDFNGMVVNDE